MSSHMVNYQNLTCALTGTRFHGPMGHDPGVAGAVSASRLGCLLEDGERTYKGLGAAALDRGSGLDSAGGGGVDFVQKRIKNCVFVC